MTCKEIADRMESYSGGMEEFEVEYGGGDLNKRIEEYIDAYPEMYSDGVIRISGFCYEEAYHKVDGNWALKWKNIDVEVLRDWADTYDKFDTLMAITYRDYKLKTCPYDILGMNRGDRFRDHKKRIMDIIKKFHPDTNPKLYESKPFYVSPVEHRFIEFKTLMNAFNELKD
jgi:hypothetical protein